MVFAWPEPPSAMSAERCAGVRDGILQAFAFDTTETPPEVTFLKGRRLRSAPSFILPRTCPSSPPCSTTGFQLGSAFGSRIMSAIPLSMAVFQPLLTKPVVGSHLFHLIRCRVHPTGEVILGQNAPLIELIRECGPNQSIEIVKVPQSSVYLIDQFLGCVVVRHSRYPIIKVTDASVGFSQAPFLSHCRIACCSAR